MDKLNRRRLLATGAAAFAASAFSGTANAEGQSSLASGPFTVRDGEAHGDGPWVIRGKDPIATKISGADVGKRFSVIELSTPPGRGPGMHIHVAQNEMFFILQGSIGIQCGTERKVLKTDDCFMAPMGVPHAYVTLGTETARILNLFDPAGEMEAFFAEYVHFLNGDGAQDMRQLAAISAKHGMKEVGPPLKASSFEG